MRVRRLKFMGYPDLRARKALLACAPKNVWSASEWLEAHKHDADIDAPIRRVPVGLVFYDLTHYPVRGRRDLKQALHRYDRLVATKGDVSFLERRAYVFASLEMTHPRLDEGQRRLEAIQQCLDDNPPIVPVTVQAALVLTAHDRSRWGRFEAWRKRFCRTVRLALESAERALKPHHFLLVGLLLWKVKGAFYPEDTVPEFLWRLAGMAVGGAMGFLRRLAGALLGVARRYAPSLLLRILRAGVRAAVALYFRVVNGLASGLLGMVRLVIRLG